LQLLLSDVFPFLITRMYHHLLTPHHFQIWSLPEFNHLQFVNFQLKFPLLLVKAEHRLFLILQLNLDPHHFDFDLHSCLWLLPFRHASLLAFALFRVLSTAPFLFSLNLAFISFTISFYFFSAMFFSAFFFLSFFSFFQTQSSTSSTTSFVSSALTDSEFYSSFTGSFSSI